MKHVTTISAEATKQVVCVEVSKNLCMPYCTTNSVTPDVNVTYSVANTKLIGDILYVRVKATGSVKYIPKGGCSCGTKTEIFTEYFMVAFTGATTDVAKVFQEEGGFVEAKDVKCGGIACGIATYNVVSITIA